MGIEDNIRAVLERPLRALALVVEDVSVTPAGRRRVVRVAVDRHLDANHGETTTATPPLRLDEVADAARAVSDELDSSDVLGEQPYVLEVTSPGVDRPLTEPRHFRRNVSRLVTITPTEGQPVTGRIQRAGEEALSLAVPAAEKTAGHTEAIRYAVISRAVVQVEFSRSGTGAADEALDQTSGDAVDTGAPADEES